MLAGASSRSGVLRECMAAYLLTLQKHMVPWTHHLKHGLAISEEFLPDFQSSDEDDLMKKYSQEYEHSEEYSEVH